MLIPYLYRKLIRSGLPPAVAARVADSNYNGSDASFDSFRYIGPSEPDTTHWAVDDLWLDTSDES